VDKVSRPPIECPTVCSRPKGVPLACLGYRTSDFLDQVPPTRAGLLNLMSSRVRGAERRASNRACRFTRRSAFAWPWCCCPASGQFGRTTVSFGSPEDWLAYSDHSAMTVDLRIVSHNMQPDAEGPLTELDTRKSG
jgi:hypothetical protein